MRPQIRSASRRPRRASGNGGAEPGEPRRRTSEYGVGDRRGASPGEMIATAAPFPRAVADGVPLDAQARLTQVYEEHIDRLTAFARLLTGNASAAEDLAHEVFTDLLQRLIADPTYLREPSWPWLRTAVTHLASKRYRSALREAKRLARLYEEPQDGDPWSHMTVDFANAISAMPPRMRLCVVLTYIEDQAAKQVSEQSGMQVRTVETQLRRARKRLRDRLGIEPGAGRSTPLQESHQ